MKKNSRFRKGLSAAVMILACASAFMFGTAGNSAADVYVYSFENDMQGWRKDATDLELGDEGKIDWSIARSTDRAYGGIWSLKYYLNNLNDAGKIWIEKPFKLEPYRTYRVTIRFWLASRDKSPVGAFRIIAGATAVNPEIREDLVYRGDTCNGGKDGFTWLYKDYVDNYVTADKDGYLWVAVGIWGNWEVPHTYYLDQLIVVFQQQ